MEEQDKIRKEIFDYLQAELLRNGIDIHTKRIGHMRAVRFLCRNHQIGIFRISNFYKYGIKFEVNYFWDDILGAIHSYDLKPISLYLMPEQAVVEMEKRRAKHLKKVKESGMPDFFIGIFTPQSPREKYITSQAEFAIKCLEAIKEKQDRYFEWLKLQALIYADLSLALPELKQGVSLAQSDISQSPRTEDTGHEIED